jgi:uncharacterized protein
MCNPFGQEAIRSHRLYKLLADRLSRMGFHVLRFDYFGTGDSDGADEEGDIVSWVGDVKAANRELLARSGCASSFVFGLRLGGTLATMCAASSDAAIDRLVLWQPIFDGRRYLHELSTEHLEALRTSYGARWILDSILRKHLSAEAESEVLGFAMSATLRVQICDVGFASLARTKAQSAYIFAPEQDLSLFDPEADLMHTLTRASVKLSLQKIEPDISWTANEMMGASMVPSVVLEAICNALGEPS